MKSVTEFWVHTLTKGISTKADLVAQGKSPEEVQTALGEAFKYEGDKLKHFAAAIEVANENKEKLSRVLVVALADGETAPPKSVKVEEHHYVPEFQAAPRAVNLAKPEARGGGSNKGKAKGGPKESPWGMTPEQKAAKKAGSAANKASKA